MKMLFYSSERADVELLHGHLVDAGIPCEIHDSGRIKGLCLRPAEAEVWIQNDEDLYRATLLCSQLNIGFAARPSLPQDLAA